LNKKSNEYPEEVMKIQMIKNEEDCEKFEEVVSLRGEVNKLNKNLKISQALE
jgi:hypothetical protein